jgi:hypothetical protein
MADGRSVWERVTFWLNDNARHLVYAVIPKDRTDEDYDDAPLQPGGSYFRLWMSEMFLTKRVSWGKQWFPAVHGEVRLQFGGQDTRFSRVAQPPSGQLSEAVRLDYRLTDLIPFNGGVVEVETALLALQGADYLGTAIGILQQFSSLVTPPLGQAITLAEKVASGTRDLLSATDGHVHLGFHQEFVADGAGGAVLRPGYIAVILAEPGQVNTDGLAVHEGQLRYRPAPGAALGHLSGYDYMLLRVEGRRERDDWRLKNIQDALDMATDALCEEPPDEVRAAAYRTVALAATWKSPDLAKKDRRRVVQAIKAELAEIADEGSNAVDVTGVRGLREIVLARAMSRDQSDALGDLTADEVFG